MKRWKVWAYVVAGIVLLNVLVAILDSFFGAPSGPPSSAYATTPEGLAAYASLLEHEGHEVSRVRDELERVDLDAGTTLILLDPQAPTKDVQVALRSFVENGGTLVAGGSAPYWLSGVADDVPTWSPDGDEGVHSPTTFSGVSEVRSAGEGSWIGSGAGEPSVGDAERPLAVTIDVGEGKAQLLADSSPLQNRLLDEADNAALGLALVDPGRDVAFIESAHGYLRGEGFGALPSRWKWFCFGSLLALCVWLWAKGRRLGPPEEPNRVLPPPRTVYVEALAATLARTERRRRGTT
jgi:hypothetical protein